MLEQVASIEELRQKPAEIRALRQGFITNFYLDSVKHLVWIKKGDCYAERKGNTLFIIKKAPAFWNVFFCSTGLEELGKDLAGFLSEHGAVKLIIDIVGRKNQCQPLVELFRENGFSEAASLTRMTRVTGPVDYEADDSIRRAVTADMAGISRLLHTYFDEKTEQIPYDEELADYARQGHVLICEEKGGLAGFLIYEINASTLYLRYWFTHPDHRDRKVGSRLLRRLFEEGKGTRRQLLWVMRSNENAIVRYRHYGFQEEDMADYVMQINERL